MVRDIEILPQAHREFTRTRLCALLAAPMDHMDLARAALWIAAEDYSDLDVESYIGAIEAMGTDVGSRLRSVSAPRARLSALISYLHEERGLCGNVETYYDARNSFLNEVLDRRLGIPLTLGIIYLEVARAVGIPLSGVCFPGHFLLRHDADETHFIDPFNPSELYTAEDCEKLSTWMAPEPTPFDPKQLRPATQRDILVRLLTNLKTIYLRAGDTQRALAAVDRILLIRPGATSEYRDRAVIYMQLEAFRLALADLEEYLPRAEDDDERQVFTIVAGRLRQHLADLN